MDLRYSIVVPAFNEAAHIEQNLEAIAAYLEARGPFEIIVVDDGSTDRTAEIAEAFAAERNNVQVLKNPTNRGKGYTVRRGMLAARGDLVLFSDADLSTPIDQLERLEAAIDSGADVACGSRAMPDSDVQVPQPWYRRLLGWGFRRLVSTMMGLGMRDTQCGFKAFRREVVESIFGPLKVERFAFDVELIYVARRLGYRIAEVPVIWRDSTQTRVSCLRDPLSMFLSLLKIRRLHRDLASGKTVGSSRGP